MTRFALFMTGFSLNVIRFFLDMTGFYPKYGKKKLICLNFINMTAFVISAIKIDLNVTGFVLY